MRSLRHHILAHRRLAVLLLGVTLALRLLIPAGFMVDTRNHAITITLCTGTTPVKMVMAMPGMVRHHDHGTEHGKTESPCAFAGLNAVALGGADAIQLAAALAFVIAAALFAPLAVRPRASPRLRPPSRGPPTPA